MTGERKSLQKSDVELAALSQKARALIEHGGDEKTLGNACRGLKIIYGQNSTITLIIYHAGIALQNKNIKDEWKDDRLKRIISVFNKFAENVSTKFVDCIFVANDHKKYQDILQLLSPEGKHKVDALYQARMQKKTSDKAERTAKAIASFDAHYSSDNAEEMKAKADTENKGKRVSFQDSPEEPSSPKPKS